MLIITEGYKITGIYYEYTSYSHQGATLWEFILIYYSYMNNKKDFISNIVKVIQQKTKLRVCKKTNKLTQFNIGICAVCNCYKT